MTETINCPQCNKENKSYEKFCIHCGFKFQIEKSDPTTDSDWLSFLRNSDEEDDSNLISLEGVEKNSNNSEQSSEGLPDWLHRIREIKQTEDEFIKIHSENLIETPSTSEIENTDLVNSLREEEKLPEDLSDNWLKEFRNISPTGENEQIDEPEVEPKPDEEISPISASLDEIKNVWQKEFPVMHEELDNSEIEPAEELPEWLNKNIFNQPGESEEQENSTIPGWLDSERSPELGDNQISNEPLNIPEWLSQSNFLVEDLPEFETPDEQSESLPDWIVEINQHKAEQKVDEENEEGELSSISKEEFDSVLLFNKLDMFPEDIDDEKFSQKDEQNLIPTSKVENNYGSKNELPDEPAFIFDDHELKNLPIQPFIGYDETSEWFEKNLLENQHNNIDEVPEDEINHKTSPFVFENIPDWLENVDLNLSDFNEDDSIQNENHTETKSEDNIVKGDLPEWLKAMRPIEVVSPDISRLQSQKSIEKSGPLAGLQGALTSQKITKTYSAPPAYSVSIKITEKQRAHIKILEEIISPKIITGSTIKTKQTLVQKFTRVLIPIFLLLIVLSSLFLDHSGQKFPELLSADSVRFFNLTTGYLNRNLTPGNVLVVFETDASAFPELNLITSGFFENLMINNHWITLVSSNPNGVLVADEILKNVKLKVPSYNFSERILNLGFLPGSGLGIHSFLTNPESTLPEGLSNSNIWNEPPLSEVNSIQDFDIIVLITDNSENAKLWVEQIHFFKPDVGFLLVSTTQASPLLQPYLSSNQIDGMISGISGGMSFNLLSKSESNSLDRHWAIVQIAVITFIVFLLAGGVTSIFSKALSNNPSGDKK
jgi:hypothetical protein